MKYYLHDTSAIDDEKVTELYMRFGYEGVGLFYVILEKIAKQEKPIKTDVLKTQLRIGKRLEKCWIFMEEIGLISSNNGETFNEQLLNFSEKYKIKKEKNAKRISDWRDRQRDIKNVTCYEHICNTPKVKESKVNNKEENIKEEKTWRNDYQTYVLVCNAEFKKLYEDENFMKEQSRLNPNLNIYLTLEKSYLNFWATEDGWNHSKKKRTEPNWKRTIINSISQPLNKVYLTR